MDAQKRIKQLMEERGWTDYRLAKEANLSHSTITNVFKRNNAPTLPTLEVICRAFGITLWDYVMAAIESEMMAAYSAKPLENRRFYNKWWGSEAERLSYTQHLLLLGKKSRA